LFDPRLAILNLLKQYWSLEKPKKEDITWSIAPYSAEVQTPQICITDYKVDFNYIAVNLYKASHQMKVGIYVKGVENQKIKYDMKEEVKKIIVNHSSEAKDLNYVFLGENWKDADDLNVKPPLLGAEGIIIAVYFVMKSS